MICVLMKRFFLTFERFVQAAKDSYPDLEEAANRYAEKGRIACWLLWNELRLEEGGAEASAGCDRVRATAMEHRRDLVLPVDWQPLLTLYLLRFAPRLAPAVRKAWRMSLARLFSTHGKRPYRSHLGCNGGLLGAQAASFGAIVEYYAS